jgi:hypothetical protein
LNFEVSWRWFLAGLIEWAASVEINGDLTIPQVRWP